MKKILFSLFVLGLLCQCQDTKKDAVKEEKKIQITDSISTKKKIKKQEKQTIYPVITQKNVTEFLTQYGKDNPETKVRITTKYGKIDLQLFKDTPLHRANFIYLVKQGYFNNTYFHRVVKGFIIQAGNADDASVPKKRKKLGNAYRLPYEKGNGRVHSYGTVSGAKEYRKNPDNMTSPYEFFIFLGKKSQTKHLNGRYTIFGKVTKGMNVVEKIANLPADEGDWPLYNVYITVEVIE